MPAPRTYDIAVLPGDGVGPEVTQAAQTVLAVIGDFFGHRFRFHEHLIGGAAIDATGDPLPQSTVDSCLAADAVLLGAVGGPRWEGGKRRPEEGLLGLRKAMGLFANLRPLQVSPVLAHRSPLKREIVEGVDLMVFRELTGGIYFGERTRTAEGATDRCEYTVVEIERVARAAFKTAQQRRGKVTSVDKANVMETSRLWREVVTRIHAEEFPRVELEHALVDSMAMHLIRKPREYDVILTENMFGDILSDEISVLGGSIGLLPSASLGESGPGLFEPIHGSAPDIAGKDIANPVGAILSAALMLRHSLGLDDEAGSIEAAVAAVLSAGQTTADLGGTLGTRAATDAIVDAIRAIHWAAAHRIQMHWA
ncbi:3-isopropylmalate dehydrogenase [Brevundimonas sp. Root1279]|uniref:3-isopropylmalate dehydrogenase n=1 Tax=Brevundimonas sp. Root1279 TaxID=1736443 RepID=UPI0006F37A8D|nr:3-isopropylmalate dehydrogenase [Brevundimonas sp. Root1279]KQW80845.1 3-isopropylmalate dehydrogenase [Brevundimonas sp. Root1279]